MPWRRLQPALDPGSRFRRVVAVGERVGSPVDERFPLNAQPVPPATGRDDEFADAIVRFWSGDPLLAAEQRRHARRAGMKAARPAPCTDARIGGAAVPFPARLLRGRPPGLADAVRRGRAHRPLHAAAARQSYAELARLAARGRGRSGVPARYGARDDRRLRRRGADPRRTTVQVVPAKLRAKQQPRNGTRWQAGAETGMRLIERDMVLLQQPDAGRVVDRTYQQLKTLHSEAFEWDAPDVAGLESHGRNPDAPVRPGMDQRVGPVCLYRPTGRTPRWRR